MSTRPHGGKVIDRTVMSGKIARSVEKAWDDAGLNRIPCTSAATPTPRC